MLRKPVRKYLRLCRTAQLAFGSRLRPVRPRAREVMEAGPLGSPEILITPNAADKFADGACAAVISPFIKNSYKYNVA